MKIIAAEHSCMYYIEWEDGSKSDRFYNLDRATELLRRLESGEAEETIKIGYETVDYDAPQKLEDAR